MHVLKNTIGRHIPSDGKTCCKATGMKLVPGQAGNGVEGEAIAPPGTAERRVGQGGVLSTQNGSFELKKKRNLRLMAL